MSNPTSSDAGPTAPARWTSADIPDLSGRTAVVTGANSGLGLVSATQLSAHGADVIMGCRDLARGEAAAESVRRTARGTVTVRRLDLADLSSVAQFATEYGDGPLDLLLNNAGVMAIPKRATADGFEMQLGTNHVGHFALTGRLLPALRRAPSSRVVTVSSTAHKMGRMNFDDLMGEHNYRPWAAYGQSKLANLLFTFEFQRRLDAAGIGILSLAAHPGYADTNLQSAGPRMKGSSIGETFMTLANKVFAQSANHGAWPQLYAATAAGLPGAAYIGPGGLAESRGHPRLVAPNKAALDVATAQRLWDVSTSLTGVTYDFA